MKVAYIKTLDGTKTINFKILKHVNIDKIDEENILLNIRKVSKKICRIIIKKLKKEKIKTVILEEKIKKKEILLEYLKNANITIIDYRNELINYTESILEYIFKLMKKNFYEEDIYFLVKEFSKENINLLDLFAEKVRTINIVTNDIKNYKRYEEYIYQQKGINITVSNNKIKSLEKAKFIVNVDYKKEEFENYNINRKSIIINLKNEIKIQKKSFEGININSIELNSDLDEKYEGFNKVEISRIMGKSVEECKIKGLIGEKGLIMEEEFINFS